MHGHLVAVEVRVECGANQRVNTDRFAFHQHRLERLNAQAVQRRCTVEKHRVIPNDVFQHLVHLGIIALTIFFGALHRFRFTTLFQLMDDERLESSTAIALGRPHW